MAEARSTVSDEEVSDEVLVNRVRAKMGRVVSHSGAIKVMAEQGRVTLEDLLRMKTYLETGKPARRSAKVRMSMRGGTSYWALFAPE